jgi:hypothetical protein
MVSLMFDLIMRGYKVPLECTKFSIEEDLVYQGFKKGGICCVNRNMG